MADPMEHGGAMSYYLDIEQVLDLRHNGFSREGAAMAVAESHGEGEEYVHALLAHPSVANTPDVFEEAGQG